MWELIVTSVVSAFIGWFLARSGRHRQHLDQLLSAVVAGRDLIPDAIQYSALATRTTVPVEDRAAKLVDAIEDVQRELNRLRILQSSRTIARAAMETTSSLSKLRAAVILLNRGISHDDLVEAIRVVGESLIRLEGVARSPWTRVRLRVRTLRLNRS